jgi:hypothetical protein
VSVAQFRGIGVLGKVSLGGLLFYCPGGAEEFSPGLNGAKIRWIWDVLLPRRGQELSQEFQPINADSMRGASVVEWFLSRRDSTIVARHEVPG